MRVHSQWVRLVLVVVGALLLVACATPPPPAPEPPRPASLRIMTDPTSAIILVAGFTLESGDRITVAPGTYDLVIELENYQRHQETLILDEGVTMDRRVEMRPLDAELTIRVEPADTELRIWDRSYTGEQTLMLRPDRYEIEASREGYFPETVRLRVNPGEQQTIDINLQRIPTAGEMTLRAHHPDARIFLNGEDQGVGSATVAKSFGDYRFESILELADWRRERAEQSISFRRGGTQRFDASLPELEYFYAEKWMPADQAIEQEQAAYHASRVADTIHVQAMLGEDLAGSLREKEDLWAWLFGLLRPGDRLTLSSEGSEVLLWARAELPDDAFAEAVNEFLAGNSFTPPWPVPEEEVAVRQVSLEEPADLAFAMLAARPYSPLLSLDGRALSIRESPQMELTRVAADGELRLLAQGGEGLMMDAINLPSDDYGLVDYRLPAATATHELAWQTPPERLLLVPSAGPLAGSPERVELKRGEKQVVTIDLPTRPARLHQLTVRQDDENVDGRWETLEWTIAPGQAPDLREVDLGPHSREGLYRRAWIFEYPEGDGNTQRQVDAEYAVGEQAAETQSGLFLRRRPSAPDGN